MSFELSDKSKIKILEHEKETLQRRIDRKPIDYFIVYGYVKRIEEINTELKTLTQKTINDE